MGELHIPLSWHIREDSPFSCLPPRQEYRTVEPNVNFSPVSMPLGGEPGWPQSTTTHQDRSRLKDQLLFAWRSMTKALLSTNLCIREEACPTVRWVDRSAPVIRTGNNQGCSHRTPPCRKWSCHVLFYSAEWSWLGCRDRSSWPLYTERHRDGHAKNTKDRQEENLCYLAWTRESHFFWLQWILHCFSLRKYNFRDMINTTKKWKELVFWRTGSDKVLIKLCSLVFLSNNFNGIFHEC